MIINWILTPWRLLFLGALSLLPDANMTIVDNLDSVYTSLYKLFQGLNAFIPMEGFLKLFYFYVQVEIMFFFYAIIKKVVRFFSFGIIHA